MYMFLECDPMKKPTHQRGTRILKNGMTFKTKELKAWEAELSASLASYSRPEHPDRPMYLKWVFRYGTKDKKKWGKWKHSKPDTDNLVKTPKDCMQRLGFFTDDSHVVYESIQKVWSEIPGIEITLSEVPPEVADLIYLEANDPDWAV